MCAAGMHVPSTVLYNCATLTICCAEETRQTSTILLLYRPAINALTAAVPAHGVHFGTVELNKVKIQHSLFVRKCSPSNLVSP